MADETNPEIDHTRRQYTKQQDFRGAVTKDGVDIATVNDVGGGLDGSADETITGQWTFSDVMTAESDVNDAAGNTVYDQSNNYVPASRVEGGESVEAEGVQTLSSGTATVSTGVTTTGTHVDVRLDPSGNGNNAADVKVSARAFWDNSAGEYKVEIIEDGTSVGNPDIGYKVVTS